LDQIGKIGLSHASIRHTGIPKGIGNFTDCRYELSIKLLLPVIDNDRS